MPCRQLPVGSSPAVFKSPSGSVLLPLCTLPLADQRRITAEWDPVAKLGLTDDAILMRSTEPCHLRGDRIFGNPSSCAQIANYHTAKPNYYHRLLHHAVNDRALSSPERRHARAMLAASPVHEHVVGCMTAWDLPVASLNVMYGSAALEGARAYARGGHRIAKLRLGDLRRAGGGEVFFDAGCMMHDADLVPLIVTLPEDASVPVEVLDLPPPDDFAEPGKPGWQR